MEMDQVCYCGIPTALRTSWTDANPGRRFRGCQNFGVEGGCRFFLWFDPPIYHRGRQIIPGLIRRVNALEKTIQAFKRKERWFWVGLTISRFISFVLWCNLAKSSEKSGVLEIM